MYELLNTEVCGNTVLDWTLAVLAVACTAIILHCIIRLAARRLGKLAAQPGLNLFDLSDALLKRTHWLFVLVSSVYIVRLILRLGQAEGQILDIVALSALFIQIGLWLDKAIVFYTHQLLREDSGMDPGALMTITAMGMLGRIVLWTVCLLLVLSNAGVNISALITGLGIIGVAGALAVQTVLGDLLASFSIMLDKPFVTGHSIQVGDYQGTVEKIGLRTTRVRSLSGEQIVFSNKDLIDSRLRNYRRMDSRRVQFSFMVTYRTTVDKLRAIPAIVQEIVEAQDQVLFDRAHFKEYQDFGLVFEVVYHVLTADYTVYMDVQQAVNLALYERFHEEGIEFAYVEGQLATSKALTQ